MSVIKLIPTLVKNVNSPMAMFAHVSMGSNSSKWSFLLRTASEIAIAMKTMADMMDIQSDILYLGVDFKAANLASFLKKSSREGLQRKWIGS